MAANNRFQDVPCSVVVSNNYDTHGTITRSSLAPLTPAQLYSLFTEGGLYADMDAFFHTAFEMNACGIKRNAMYDWLMSSARNMKHLLPSPIKIDKGPSLLHPFILGRQMSVINNDYWAIPASTYGWSVSSTNPYTALVTGPLTTADLALGASTDRIVRIVTRYGIDMDKRWFQAKSDGSNGDIIHIFSRASGATLNGQWLVLASETATDLSYVDVLITSLNAGSNSSFDATPGRGSNASVVVRGGNNVNDYETYCLNRPTLDPRKAVPFFYKTDRRARLVDSQYKEFFARAMESNEYFRNFGDLPLAERNRQDEEIYQRAMVNNIFFGKGLANQSLANWQSLAQITSVSGATVDPGTGGQIIAYRAEPVGILEQQFSCGQVRDLQNNSLNFYDFLNELYTLQRARKSAGHNWNSMDVYMDSVQAANFQQAAVAYWIAKFGNILSAQFMLTPETNEIGFRFQTYRFDFPAGLEVNIVTDDFFDDLVNATNAESVDSAGRYIMILEIGNPGRGGKGGSIYPGMIASNRKQRTVGEIERLAAIDSTFSCVMENPTTEVSLTSQTWTVIDECPSNSLIIQGVGSGVPVTTGLSSTHSPSLLY